MQTVLVEIFNPIFKNGKLVTGMSELEINTALRFQIAGDLRIIDEVEIQTIEIQKIKIK